MMKPHPAGDWSYHTTQDPIIEVNGDTASLDTQFVVFEVQGKLRPATGWPEGLFGAQGDIRPTEAGYYRPVLRRIECIWRIITLGIPMAFPGQ
jgi:hypothetical protein